MTELYMIVKNMYEVYETKNILLAHIVRICLTFTKCFGGLLFFILFDVKIQPHIDK